MGSITVRVPDELLNAIQRKLYASNYANRSDLIRDLLRRWLNSVPLEVKIHERKT